MPAELIAQLDAWAVTRDLTRAGAIRAIVETALNPPAGLMKMPPKARAKTTLEKIKKGRRL